MVGGDGARWGQGSRLVGIHSRRGLIGRCIIGLLAVRSEASLGHAPEVFEEGRHGRQGSLVICWDREDGGRWLRADEQLLTRKIAIGNE